MNRKGKTQRAIGIVLLITLLVPVIMLSVSQTRTEIVFHEVRGPGMVTMIEPEYIEITYTPLVALLHTAKATFTDISFFVVYIGLFVLAVWLMVHSRRYKLKEA